MYRIFYNERSLSICGVGENPGEGAVELGARDNNGRAAAATLLAADRPESLYMQCKDTGSAYRAVCAEFKEVNAAGGLVRDDGGRRLMIFRNGRWDLPKGHQEPGEDIRDTAVREIAEETGITGITRGNLICITDHCYLRDGIWHLKHTWWYDCHIGQPAAAKPQTEEGISEVSWAGRQDVVRNLSNTYPSIREVFAKSLKLF